MMQAVSGRDPAAGLAANNEAVDEPRPREPSWIIVRRDRHVSAERVDCMGVGYPRDHLRDNRILFGMDGH
jgi:hypothetical protein